MNWNPKFRFASLTSDSANSLQNSSELEFTIRNKLFYDSNAGILFLRLKTFEKRVTLSGGDPAGLPGDASMTDIRWLLEFIAYEFLKFIAMLITVDKRISFREPLLASATGFSI